MTPTAIDLFCGAGGLSLGLEEAGFRIAGAFDAWSPAVRSYRLNFPGHPCFMEDVDQLDAARLSVLGMPNEPDLVAGGPPCQGFSAQRIGGDDDQRNDLVLSFLRVATTLRSRMFVMENVTGLLGARGRATLARFMAIAEASGYVVRTSVLDAADFGLPQHRQRVFVVGRRRDVQGSFTFPQNIRSCPMTVAEALSDLAPPAEEGATEPVDPLHVITPLSALNRRRIEMVPPGGGFEDLPIELRANCHKAGAARIGHRAVYGRLHPDRPAGTITAMFDSFTRGRFGHPVEPRNLTLREGARLQGFPDGHRFVGTKREMVKQIGNAVPPPMARAIAVAVRAALDGKPSMTERLEELPLLAFG